MTECSVCLTTLTKTQEVNCVYCSYTTCRKCIERYSLETTEDIHCMNCRRPFDRNAQVKMFTKVFVDKNYKRRREDLWFDREMALMPNTQDAANVERKRRATQKEIEGLRSQYHDMMDAARNISRQMNRLHHRLYNGFENDEDEKTSQFSIRCSHEGCRGYLSTAYKCGTCDQYTCPECHEPKAARIDPNHVCEPNKVASVKLIQKDCKNCPSCSTPIYKSIGCSQMFCTQCNSLFDWNTLRPLYGKNAHNPHYLEWIRQTGGQIPRDVGDIVCGGLPLGHQLNQRSYREDKTLQNLTWSIYQCVSHVQHHERPAYPTHWNDDQQSQYLRIKWLLNDISTETFKITRQRMEKKANLKKEVGMVMEMFVNACTDIFQRYMQTTPMGLSELCFECDRVRKLANDRFKIIANDFKNMTPKIGDNWTFYSKMNH